MTTAGVFLVDVGRDFSQYPAGRTNKDGDFNGTAFRERFLIPHLKNLEKTRVLLDTAYAYGSSFLEEAFGGLVREGVSKAIISDCLELVSADETLKMEIGRYVEKAKPAGAL